MKDIGCKLTNPNGERFGIEFDSLAEKTLLLEKWRLRDQINEIDNKLMNLKRINKKRIEDTEEDHY